MEYLSRVFLDKQTKKKMLEDIEFQNSIPDLVFNTVYRL